jgi:hypothetical protein
MNSQILDSPLLFIHLTKTAGGSLKELVKSILNHQSLFYYDDDQLPTINSDSKIIFGHFRFGLHEKMNLPPKYACIFRHPITRTISHYYHLYNHDQSFVGETIRNSDQDINEFFEKSYHWEFENFMCKILSGINDTELYDSLNSLSAYHATLKNVYNSFEFIGLFEYLDLSIYTLLKKINIQETVVNIPKVNIGNYNISQVSEKTIERICELNYYDILLYRKLAYKFLRSYK